MREMHRARYGQRAPELPALRVPFSQHLRAFFPGSSLHPTLLDVLGSFTA